jgi:hypothetical protein
MNHGYKEYLVSHGFDRPKPDEGYWIYRSGYKDRYLRLDTAPMLRNQFELNLCLPGLEDNFSVFKFGEKFLDFDFTRPTYCEYVDLKNLSSIFGLIVRIHEAWLNDLLGNSQIESFVKHVNEVRRKHVDAYARMTKEEKDRHSTSRVEKFEHDLAKLTQTPEDDWSRETYRRIVASLEESARKKA